MSSLPPFPWQIFRGFQERRTQPVLQAAASLGTAAASPSPFPRGSQHLKQSTFTELALRNRCRTFTELALRNRCRTFTELARKNGRISFIEPAQRDGHVTFTEPAQRDGHVTFTEPAQRAGHVTFTELAQRDRHVTFTEPAQRDGHVTFTEPAQRDGHVSFTEPVERWTRHFHWTGTERWTRHPTLNWHREMDKSSYTEPAWRNGTKLRQNKNTPLSSATGAQLAGDGTARGVKHSGQSTGHLAGDGTARGVKHSGLSTGKSRLSKDRCHLSFAQLQSRAECNSHWTVHHLLSVTQSCHLQVQLTDNALGTIRMSNCWLQPDSVGNNKDVKLLTAAWFRLEQ